MRQFAIATPQACLDHLKSLGIKNKNVVYNPSVGELYEYAMMSEHLGSPDPNIYNTTITNTGALSASSGLRTGRSPKDKRIVEDDVTKNTIWWGDVNMPISE